MLISCKCLNFIATSNKNQPQQSQQQQQQQQQVHQLQQQKSLATGNAPADVAPVSPFKQQKPSQQLYTAVGNECNHNNNNNNNNSSSSLNSCNGNMVSAELMHAFLQKYPRNFVFYSQCMEFFKQAIGPIPDLTINAVNQRDLIYSLTLDVQQQMWQISVCINCNVALCAKRLQPGNTSPSGSAPLPNLPVYLINSDLQTSNDELTHRRAERSFSDTFGVLIMDHPESEIIVHSGNVTPTAISASNSAANAAFNIGSLNAMTSFASDPKQQRLRQLQQNLQQRLQREIAETDERIQRYTAQQFALLRSFREKSEQEFELLVRIIQRVPEQATTPLNGCGLDRAPPALDVCEGVSYVARRRNTITGRRDLNGLNVTNGTATTVGGPTTPTSPYAPMQFNLAAPHQMHQRQQGSANNGSAMETTSTTTITDTAVKNNNTNNNHNNNTQQSNGATNSSTVTVIKANNNNRRMSNFDTPPATPEATPMSVGSSPTFQQETKQQQQQQQQKSVDKKQQQQPLALPLQSAYARQQQQQQQQQQQSFGQQYPTPNEEANDTIDADCLFEWDGDDMVDQITTNYYNHAVVQSSIYQQQQQQQQLYQRSMSIVSNQQDNTMSDLDESDGAEEAEDAIDLDSSQPIPMQADRRGNSLADRLNFGKSLPIDIAVSPMLERNNYINDSHDEDLDCTLDIAASIKALAKSVHGEAVFGDLPRPRLRSQI